MSYKADVSSVSPSSEQMTDEIVLKTTYFLENP